jgi:hypothetical protein
MDSRFFSTALFLNVSQPFSFANDGSAIDPIHPKDDVNSWVKRRQVFIDNVIG